MNSLPVHSAASASAGIPHGMSPAVRMHAAEPPDPGTGRLRRLGSASLHQVQALVLYNANAGVEATPELAGIDLYV